MEKIKSNKGFTLLEVIFAVSILTVGILAVAAMQASSIRGNAFAWDTSEAVNVAMGQIEEMMEWDYDDLITSGTPVTEGRYSISWTVAENMIIDQTKTVDLTVSWTDRGSDRNLAMSVVIGHVI